MTSAAAAALRVCLISPPFDRQKVYSGMAFAAPIEPPLGLAFIAAMLRQRGFDVRLIDSTTLGYGLPQLQRLIVQWRPQLVGISANTPVYPVALEAARMVKRAAPEATVVLGGCHPTVFPQRVIANPEVDAVVVGEGEQTMAEIAAAVAAGRDLTGIAGVVHRRDGQVVSEPERPFIEDLDSLPPPAFDLLPLRKYRISLGMARHTPAISMMASRGCPMNCKFCTSPGIWKRCWRRHSPRYVGEVLQTLALRHGVRHVQFRDDTFTVNQQWVEGICDELLRRGLRLSWDCYSTVSLVREDMARRMKQAGCTCLSMGIESGNDEMLRKYKGTSTDEVRQKMALLRRVGLQTRLFFMLAPPAERREHLDETLAFALELDPDFAMFTPTLPLPGAALYDELLQAGVPLPDYDHQLQNFQTILYAPPPFSVRELEEFRSLCYRRFYFRPSYLCRMVPKLLNWDSAQRGWEAVRQIPLVWRRR
jgi:radical SAM superfamily enzyme YgiQ (UPF0313 family)